MDEKRLDVLFDVLLVSHLELTLEDLEIELVVLDELGLDLSIIDSEVLELPLLVCLDGGFEVV